MKNVSKISLLLSLSLIISLLLVSFAAADVEIYIDRGETDTDFSFESVGIENAYGTSGVSKLYSTNAMISQKAYGFRFTEIGSLFEYVPSYNWITLNNPTSLNLGDDEVSQFIDMGFTTNFYNNTHNQVAVSSNGFATFAYGTHGCCAGQNLPDTAVPNNLVAGWWEDLRPASGGGVGTIKYQAIGTSPDRKFVVEFHNVGHYGNNNKKVSFQIVLLEN